MDCAAKRRWAVDLASLALALVLGCGGENAAQGTVDGGSMGGALSADGAIPRKNGVPIGDCVDPSREELTSLSCPLDPPQDSEPCSDFGKVCRYAIDTFPTASTRATFQCTEQNRNWERSVDTCGYACDFGLGNVVELNHVDCAGRPLTGCEMAATAQDGLDKALSSFLSVCSALLVPLRFQVQTIDGCPARLSSSQPFSPSQLECLVGGLSRLRFQCALLLECGDVIVSFI